MDKQPALNTHAVGLSGLALAIGSVASDPSLGQAFAQHNWLGILGHAVTLAGLSFAYLGKPVTVNNSTFPFPH